MFSYKSTWERHCTVNNKINGSCKSLLLVRFPKTHPLFHVDVFWSRSGNFCLHWKILCASPNFDLSCMKLTAKNSRFQNFGFQVLSNDLSFGMEQSMPTTEPLRKPATNYSPFFAKKSSYYWSSVWLRWRLRESSPLRNPFFRLSAFEFAVTCRWDLMLQNTALPSNGHVNAEFCLLFNAMGARSVGDHRVSVKHERLPSKKWLFLSKLLGCGWLLVNK